MVKTNWVRLTVIILLFLASIYYYLSVPREPTKLEFKEFLGKYFPVASESLPDILLSRVIGNTLDLNFFDVCLTNGSYSLKGEQIQKYPIGVTLFPIKENALLLNFYNATERMFPTAKVPPSGWSYVVTNILVANASSTACTQFSNSDGFLYSAMHVYNRQEPLGPTTFFWTDSAENFILSDEEKLYPGATVLEVRPNKLSILVKSIGLFFGLYGLWRLLESIYYHIFSKKDSKHGKE